MEVIDAALAIVLRGKRILICQRKDDDTFGGYWEFPGGKQEAGESLEQCLARELIEEINIRVRPIRRLPPIEHQYPQAIIRHHPFICAHESGEPKPIECQRALWIRLTELRDYRFPPDHQPLIEHLTSGFDFPRTTVH